MTPKEKAQDLFDKYLWQQRKLKELANRGYAKEGAIIVVEEILTTVSMCIPYLDETTYVEYWQEVKEEIKKL